MALRKSGPLLALILATLLSCPALAVASHEVPGTTLRLSLDPDDPFFIDGDVVSVIVEATAATTVSGDVGIGVALPRELSASACPSAGDQLLSFLALGTGGGSQCLSSWLSTPTSRITQFHGVTLPAGFHVRAELLRLPITASLPRAVLVFFGYILDSANPAVIRDGATTTLDIE